MNPGILRQPELLIAHRGVPALAPEGSARGFLAAIDAGAAAVELDVRPTADGLLVVCHDETPDRLTGEEDPVWQRSSVDLASRAYLADPTQRLLTLDEALALLARRTFVDIELKPTGDVAHVDFAQMLFEALQRVGSPRSVVVTSASAGLLAEVKEHAPLLATGLVFRADDNSDGVARAAEMGCSLVAANRVHVTRAFCAEARARNLVVWAYTVNDPGEARQLFEVGCDGIVTDDLPGMSAAIRPSRRSEPMRTGPEHSLPRTAARILAIDLGSTTTKVALVDPQHGLVDARSCPTPVSRPQAGHVEHDATELLEAVRGLIAELARTQPEPPTVAALASQRSTGLWIDRDTLRPLSPALSWRDERGAEVVASLEPDRVRLEAVTGLPLLAAYTAVKGRVLREGRAASGAPMLVPLGSFVAAALTGAPPSVDPTLANRMFLLEATTGSWSEELLDRFELTPEELPALVPTVADRGSLAWGDSGEVPLRVLIGDQQAAYVGIGGPTGSAVVVNVGSAAFVMKTWRRGNPLPRGARRAPLWTSSAKPRGEQVLLEVPVLDPLGIGDEAVSGADAAMQLARRVACGDEQIAQVVREIRRAVTSLVAPADRSLVVTGGHLRCPQLRHLLAEELPLEALETAELESTLLGAARMAAAASAIPWSLDGGGGLNPILPPPEE